MKSADLGRAAALAEKLADTRRVVKRLTDGEKLRLTVGAAGHESELVLTPAFAASLRDAVLGSLGDSIAEIEASLAALGVEP